MWVCECVCMCACVCRVLGVMVSSICNKVKNSVSKDSLPWGREGFYTGGLEPISSLLSPHVQMPREERAWEGWTGHLPTTYDLQITGFQSSLGPAIGDLQYLPAMRRAQHLLRHLFILQMSAPESHPEEERMYLLQLLSNKSILCTCMFKRGLHCLPFLLQVAY